MKDIILRFSYEDVAQKDLNMRHEVARALRHYSLDTGKDINFSTIRHIVESDEEKQEVVVTIEDTNVLSKFEQLPVVIIKETKVDEFEKWCAELVTKGYYMMVAHIATPLLIAVYVLPRYIFRSDYNPQYLPSVIEELNKRDKRK